MFDWNWDQTGVFEKLIINRDPSKLDLGVLRFLGFVHLITESGIHLYALMGVSLAVCERIARFSRFEIRKSWLFGCLAGALLCVCAWSLTGWRVGLFRPFVSVLLRTLGQILGYRFHWAGPLVLALVLDIVILGEKSAPGRIHYAFAVAGGLWVWERVRGTAGSHFKMAVVSWFGTALVDVWEVGILSIFTPIWSLISIPLFATVCFPIMFLGYLGLFDALVFYQLMNEAIVLCVKIAFQFPGIVLVSKPILLVSIVLGFIATFLKMRLRVFLVCVALIVGMILPDKNFIIQKNVGQGDALLYRDKKQATMIDTGEYRNEKDSQWMRFFFQNQVINIDQILFTHLDSDHASAARRIERLIPVKECWVAREHLRERKSPCVFTPTVEPVESQNLKISTISTDSKKGNSTMTGVWIRTEDLDYLNLGDADMRLEWRLFQNLKKKWKGESYSRYRIFKITHHGSRYSLSEKLLNSYDPDEAWMSVGARNRHGHPASRTMQLLGYARVNVRRTDVEGDLFSPL